MSRQGRTRGGSGQDDGPVARAEASAPGKRPAVARRAGGGTEIGAEDVAAEAIAGKSAGRPVDAGVRGQVEPLLGVDLGDVRVHQDPDTQLATHAIGARAFAYGNDVFLGPGESATDVGLMAHELTHVAQQGAAGAAAPQGKPSIEPAGSPAEREADAVAAQATAGGAAVQSGLLADRDAGPGQLTKAEFLALLKSAVTQAATRELGPVWSAIGCPHIDRVFNHYGGRSAREIEAALHRYAPETAGAESPVAYVAPVVARVRVAANEWVRTGKIPENALALLPGAGGLLRSSAGAGEARPGAAAGGAAPTVARLGDGQPLDSGVASQIGDAYGQNLSAVRVHTGGEAAQMARAEGAKAFTVGSHIAFADGQYRPNTPEGDALIAHEAAHVVQQKKKSPEEEGEESEQPGEAHERDADRSAKGALARIYLSARGAVSRLRENAVPALESGFALQRCFGDDDAASYADPQVADIAKHVSKGDAAAAHAAIGLLGGKRAGDVDIRTILDDGTKIDDAASFRGSVLLEVGPESTWPPLIRNYVWGVDNGVWPEGRLCPTGGMYGVAEYMIHKSEHAAIGSDAKGEYRARFNAKYYVPPYKDLAETMEEPDAAALPTSKGPRSPRARKIFEDLYNDPALDVKRLYDSNTPPGFRELCDTLNYPDGINMRGSAGIEMLHRVFRGQAKIAASGRSDAAYVAFRTRVEGPAAELSAGDRASIARSNVWQGLINGIVEGPDEAVTSELRADLFEAVTSTHRAGARVMGPAPLTTVDDPEPALDAAGKDFLSGIRFAPAKAKVKSHGATEDVMFNVESAVANPGLNVHASIDVEPSAQVRSGNPNREKWEAGKKKVEVGHTLATEGTGPKTEFTATLRVPPVRDGNFAPQTAKVEIEDERLDWFKRSALVQIYNVGGSNVGEVKPGKPAQYFGGQLPLDFYPGLPEGNPGLGINVEGEVRPPGRAPVTFASTPLPSGRSDTLLGQTVLTQPAGMRKSELIEYDVHFTDTAGTRLVTRSGTIKALRGAAASSSGDRHRMAHAHARLRHWLAPGGALYKHMTKPGGNPLQARVARACRNGLIKTMPMIIRSNSAQWLHDNGIADDNLVAWASDVVDDAHTFADSPNAVGFQATPGEVMLSLDMPVADVAEFLTHEAVHAVDIEPGGASGDWESYKTEFRAYWLSNYQHLSSEIAPGMTGFGPRSERARAIFEHLYYSETYDYVKTNYDNNTDGFREKADNYVFPDGINLLVTKEMDELRKTFEAASGKPFPDAKAEIEGKYAALSELEKRNISTSHTWRDMVEQKFKGKTFGAPPEGQDVIIKRILNIAS